MCKVDKILNMNKRGYNFQPNQLNKLNSYYVVFGTSISFQIIDFNYKIINEEFVNDKIWVVILIFSTLTTLKTMV